MSRNEINFRNPHLSNASRDVLYHLAIDKSASELKAEFGDVKFVCLGGTSYRMRDLALHMCAVLNENPDSLEDLAAAGHRYCLYKVGPVLSVSHGIGSCSFIVVLHEIVKLLAHAECSGVTFIRVGTSGGIGVEGGTVVVSTGAVNDLLMPYHEFRVLGNIVRRDCQLDEVLAQEIAAVGTSVFPDINIVTGKTMGTTDFYEAQGRLDGAICEFGEADKMKFLEKLHQLGVRNIEMEASMFSAFCHHLHIPSAIVCVALLNRLNGDQVTTPPELYRKWQDSPIKVVGEFIRQKLDVSR